MDIKTMMHIHARVGVCGAEKAPYLRMRPTTKQTDKPNASFTNGAQAVSQRDGVGERGRAPHDI
ncbi:hypothetical protein ABIA24_001756 [Sinorhizobium fredii]|uniref:hypothetical protein n=1 Tax=Rhizobium fredii TaxID=380 RepID=UPI0035160C49